MAGVMIGVRHPITTTFLLCDRNLMEKPTRGNMKVPHLFGDTCPVKVVRFFRVIPGQQRQRKKNLGMWLLHPNCFISLLFIYVIYVPDSSPFRYALVQYSFKSGIEKPLQTKPPGDSKIHSSISSANTHSDPWYRLLGECKKQADNTNTAFL